MMDLLPVSLHRYLGVHHSWGASRSRPRRAGRFVFRVANSARDGGNWYVACTGPQVVVLVCVGASPTSVLSTSPTPGAHMIIFACSGCGKKLQVEESQAGRKARCPYCTRVVQVAAAQVATAKGAGESRLLPASVAATLDTPPPV